MSRRGKKNNPLTYDFTRLPEDLLKKKMYRSYRHDRLATPEERAERKRRLEKGIQYILPRPKKMTIGKWFVEADLYFLPIESLTGDSDLLKELNNESLMYQEYKSAMPVPVFPPSTLEEYFLQIYYEPMGKSLYDIIKSFKKQGKTLVLFSALRLIEVFGLDQMTPFMMAHDIGELLFESGEMYPYTHSMVPNTIEIVATFDKGYQISLRTPQPSNGEDFVSPMPFLPNLSMLKIKNRTRRGFNKPIGTLHLNTPDTNAISDVFALYAIKGQLTIDDFIWADDPLYTWYFQQDTELNFILGGWSEDTPSTPVIKIDIVGKSSDVLRWKHSIVNHYNRLFDEAVRNLRKTPLVFVN